MLQRWDNFLYVVNMNGEYWFLWCYVDMILLGQTDFTKSRVKWILINGLNNSSNKKQIRNIAVGEYASHL